MKKYYKNNIIKENRIPKLIRKFINDRDISLSILDKSG